MSNKLLILSLISALSWGVSMYFNKPAVTKGDWWSATVWANLSTLVPILVILLISSKLGIPSLKTNFGCILNAAMSGVMGIVGGIFYRLALLEGKVSLIVIVTSLYPVVTIAMGIFILGERILPQQWVGIVVIIIGLILISVKQGG